MSILKKLGIALLVILLLLAIFAYFVTRGDTANLTVDEVAGTDPTLEDPDAETYPTVAIACTRRATGSSSLRSCSASSISQRSYLPLASSREMVWG